MPELEKLVDDLNFQSDQLSTNTRTIALSLLALSWGLLIGTDKVSFPISQQLRFGLLRVGAFVIGALGLDFFQYVCGYLNTSFLLKWAETQKQTQVSYSRRAPFYIARMVFFWAKITAVLAIAIYFFWLVVPLLWSSSTSH